MTQGIRGRIYRHKKRGSLYRVLEIGNMQCASPEYDDALMIVYEGLDGCVWVRPLHEFQDGRFEQVPKDGFDRRDSDSRRMAETGTGSVRSTASAGPTAIAQTPSSEPTP